MRFNFINQFGTHVGKVLLLVPKYTNLSLERWFTFKFSLFNVMRHKLCYFIEALDLAVLQQPYEVVKSDTRNVDYKLIPYQIEDKKSLLIEGIIELQRDRRSVKTLTSFVYNTICEHGDYDSLLREAQASLQSLTKLFVKLLTPKNQQYEYMDRSSFITKLIDKFKSYILRHPDLIEANVIKL